MRHLRSDTLEKYSLRRLTEAQVVRAEEHLIVCSACRESLDEFEAFRQALRQGLSANALERPIAMSVVGGD